MDSLDNFHSHLCDNQFLVENLQNETKRKTRRKVENTEEKYIVNDVPHISTLELKNSLF